MNLLQAIASLLGIEARDVLDGLRKNAILWGAIALFALIALAFLLVAANAGLTLWVGPIMAPLIIAGTAVVIALAIYIVAAVTAEGARRREAERRRAAERTALVTTAAIAALPALLKSPLMRNVGLPLGGALAALYLLSRAGGTADDDADAAD